MSSRLFHHPSIYQPLLIVIITGAFDVIVHYTCGIYVRPRTELAALAAVLLSGIVCAILTIHWQRNLRRQTRLLELHLHTRQLTQAKVHTALQVIISVTEKLSTKNPEQDKRCIIEQVRSIERKIAFDPAILVENAMLQADTKDSRSRWEDHFSPTQ